MDISPWIYHLFDPCHPLVFIASWGNESSDLTYIVWGYAMKLPFDNFLQYSLVLVLWDSKQLLFVYLATHEFIDSDVFSRLTSLFTHMSYESCSLPLIIFCPFLYFPEFYHAIFKMEERRDQRDLDAAA